MTYGQALGRLGTHTQRGREVEVEGETDVDITQVAFGADIASRVPFCFDFYSCAANCEFFTRNYHRIAARACCIEAGFVNCLGLAGNGRPSDVRVTGRDSETTDGGGGDCISHLALTLTSYQFWQPDFHLLFRIAAANLSVCLWLAKRVSQCGRLLSKSKTKFN